MFKLSMWTFALALMGMLMNFAASESRAEVVSKAFEYKQGDATLKGEIAADAALAAGAKVPGVVVVHEWWGINDYAKKRARDIAGLGYVGLAADIYGDGQNSPKPEEAGKWAGKFKNDRALLRARVQAAIDALKADPRVDPKKIAVMGYCFGGTTSLEAARSGADIAGVVSFHGSLDSPTPADAKNIKCRVLVLHGSIDPTTPPEQIAAFQKEMIEGGVDWEMVLYRKANHGFTNANNPTEGKVVAYNADADKRSWAEMQRFFNEIFAK